MYSQIEERWQRHEELLLSPESSTMHLVTIRLPDDTHRILSDEANESGRSMSEVVREYVAKEGDYDELKRENERLRAEKRTLIRNREEHTELVEYLKHERELDRQRDRRRQAPAWRRAKWWLLGEPADDE